VKFVSREEEKCNLMKSATEYGKVRPTTVLQDEEKCIFMKSAAEYWKSAPNGCFCRTKKNVFYEKGCSSRKQKNVFYEKRNSDWNICSADNVLA
jgi:hypothetical protein